MTAKKYTQRPRLSHRRAQPASGRPFARHYAALQGADEHPLDKVIDRIPAVAAVDRKVRQLARYWQEQVSDREGFIAYEDQRLAQRVLREELFFDAGYEHGRVAGRAESLAASIKGNAASLDLAWSIRRAIASTILPRSHVAALLLELARALALDCADRRSR